MSLLVGPLVVAADAYEIFRACEVHDKPDIPVCELKYMKKDGMTSVTVSTRR